MRGIPATKRNNSETVFNKINKLECLDFLQWWIQMRGPNVYTTVAIPNPKQPVYLHVSSSVGNVWYILSLGFLAKPHPECTISVQ